MSLNGFSPNKFGEKPFHVQDKRKAKDPLSKCMLDHQNGNHVENF